MRLEALNAHRTAGKAALPPPVANDDDYRENGKADCDDTLHDKYPAHNGISFMRLIAQRAEG